MPHSGDTMPEQASESLQRVAIDEENGTLTYRKEPDDRLPNPDPESCEMPIETREVNEYATFEDRHEGFESRIASNQKYEALRIVIRDPRTGECDVRRPAGYDGWDMRPPSDRWEMHHSQFPGILYRTDRSWGDQQRSGSTGILKVEREAVENVSNLGEGRELWVLEIEHGHSASRDSPETSWFDGVRATKLVPA